MIGCKCMTDLEQTSHISYFGGGSKAATNFYLNWEKI